MEKQLTFTLGQDKVFAQDGQTLQVAAKDGNKQPLLYQGFPIIFYWDALDDNNVYAKLAFQNNGLLRTSPSQILIDTKLVTCFGKHGWRVNLGQDNVPYFDTIQKAITYLLKVWIVMYADQMIEM